MRAMTSDEMLADARSGAYAYKAYLAVNSVRRGPPFKYGPLEFYLIESISDVAAQFARLAVSFARDAGTLPPEPWGS